MRSALLLSLFSLAVGCSAGSNAPLRFSSSLLGAPAPPRRWKEPRASKKRRAPRRKRALGPAVARRARAQIGRRFAGRRQTATRAFLAASLGRAVSTSLVRSLEARARASRPRSGDLVFFRDLHDRAADVGVVIEASGSAISFAYLSGPRVRLGVLDLRRPDLRRYKGRVINSYVRVKRPEDRARARYLAGQLLRGFARL